MNDALVFKGQQIRARRDGEMVNLTDMWRASGAPEERRPNDWLAGADARKFREFLELTVAVNSGNALVEASRGGGHGGGATWAHWQLAMAYAKSLSPEFHAWCNEVVRAYMHARPAAPVDAPSRSVGIWERLLNAVLIHEDEPLAEYETMMSDSLVSKLVRLDGKGKEWSGGRHPRYLRSTNKALYDRVFSREVGALLTERTPNPSRGNSYPMRLTEAGRAYWRKALVVIETCAGNAFSKAHFWDLIEREFGGGLLQLPMAYAKDKKP